MELEPTTAAIAAYLYPKARHINNGFQNIPLNTPSFDLAVGNPPFGNQSLYDPEFPELKKFSIHNYFLAKSMRLLREGGIAAFVVSRYFMDAVDSSAREQYLAIRRLPGGCPSSGNGIPPECAHRCHDRHRVFQRHDGENKRSRDWVNTASIEIDDLKNGGRRPATVNSYFVENPRQIIGTLAYSGGMFEGALACLPDPAHADLGQEIAARLDVLPADCFVPREEIRSIRKSGYAMPTSSAARISSP